jgi:hypothetical protein
MFGYACLKDANRPDNATTGLTRSAIVWSVAIVITLVCGFAWATTAANQFLPLVTAGNRDFPRPLILQIITDSTFLLLPITLAVLWARRYSVLDYSIMLVVCALFSELTLTVLSNGRFTLGFYTGRAFSLVTSLIVLIVCSSQK